MKVRKFWKKTLRIRNLFVLLIVLTLGVLAIFYFAVGLDENRLVLDNMEFSSEGFVDFKGKTDDDVNRNKVVAENDKFIMFMDEGTTIVTVAVKSSLISGQSKNNPNSYKIKYQTADPDGSSAKLANFNLSYSTDDISHPVNKTLDAYTSSVKYTNGLTGEIEKHYAIKYLESDNAVQVQYSIGQFGNTASYFTQNFYSTLYEPARCLYDTEEEWLDAVAKYESDYLSVVGDINNTYEEKFRGNVQIITRLENDTVNFHKVVQLEPEIKVFSQVARDYLLDVVFPELEKRGYSVPAYDESVKADMDASAQKNAEKNGKSKVEWSIKGVPVELLDYEGELYNEFFNNENTPLTNNPFLLTNHYIHLPYKEYTVDGNTVKHAYYHLDVTAGPAATTLYNQFYSDAQSTQSVGTGKNQVTYTFVKKNANDEYVPVSSSGYVARDEEGNFIRDENGILVKKLYSLEDVEKENAIFGVATEGVAVFKVALEFKLTNDGLVVSIPAKGLVDSSNVKEDDPEYSLINGRYKMRDIKLCPTMTNVDNTQNGYMIIPDGSGAIVNFNNGKTETVSGTYYGNDLAYVTPVQPEESAQLLLGMFAFVNTTETNPGGLLAVIEKGAGQVSLTAGVSQQFKENYANYTINLRNKEAVLTGTVADSSSYDKFDKILSPSDIVINYLIIDETELDYTSVAKKYQNYLVKRDGLEFKDNTNSLLTDLTMLGTYEKYALLLGVKYKTSDTLTTFDQAEEIINELYNNNVNNLSVSYKGWSNEHLEYELGGKLKVANVLGKTASMRSFYNICVEKGISFYPELSITTAKGYDYLLGSTRFTARGVGNEEAIHYQYDLATGRPDKKLSKTYAISPLYYKSITEKLITDFNKLNIWNTKQNGGFYLTDLGNQWTGNYHENDQVYGAEAVLYQQQVLAMLGEGSKIKIEAPCDYAFKYVDIATSVPVSSAMYTIYDQTIPFYQLVISGLFDYTTDNINGLSNRSSAWYFAKILESGSNTSFLISAEDPSVLLETDYTQYYQAYYDNWRETIISFAKQINELGIHNCYLSKHESVDGLSRVTYTSKTNPSEQIVLVVNVTEVAKNYNDTVIPGYGYIKEK